jgi:hypothetical protein
MSKASTRKVVTNGRINVSQGQWIAMATSKAAVEMKNKIQYNPFLLFLTSIIGFCAKIGKTAI